MLSSGRISLASITTFVMFSVVPVLKAQYYSRQVRSSDDMDICMVRFCVALCPFWAPARQMTTCLLVNIPLELHRWRTWSERVRQGPFSLSTSLEKAQRRQMVSLLPAHSYGIYPGQGARASSRFIFTRSLGQQTNKAISTSSFHRYIHWGNT